MDRIRHPLVTAASAVIIIAGMHAAAPLVNVILVAFLLAMSLTPLMELAIKKGMKPALAVTLTVLVVVVGGLLLSLIIGSSISRMIDILPTYQPRLAEIRASVVTLMAGWGIDASRLIAGAHLEPERIIEIAGGFLSAGLSIASSSLIVVLIMVFILIEASSTIVKIRKGEKAGGIMYRYLLYGKEVRKYISIVSLSGLITAAGNTILLLILGVDFAVLWGVLSFFMNFVPNLGFIFSLIPPAGLALLVFGWQKALIVVVGFFIINSISENVIKTRFMAKGLDVSLLLVIISLMVWTWTLGPMGTILGVPLTLVLYRGYMESVVEPGSAATGVPPGRV
jgi:predicted PurR-regulated permease PerM